MKKIGIGIVSLLILVAAGAYMYFSGKEYEIRISESQIQEKLAQKLPLAQSYGRFFL